MAVKLVKVTDVQKRISIGQHEDQVTAVEDALIGASTLLSELIGTKLDKATNVVEIFRPSIKKFWSSTPDNLIRLRLKNGFVDSGSVSVKFGGVLSDVKGHNGETVPTDEYNLKAEEGVIYIEDGYDETYLSVQYSHGLNGATDAGTDVPDWLKEAALAAMPIILSNQQVSNRSAELDVVVRQLDEQIINLISLHNRVIPFAHNPLF